MEAEFDVLDENKKEQIAFEDMVKWAFKKNMLVELLKQEEKENEKDMGKVERNTEDTDE